MRGPTVIAAASSDIADYTPLQVDPDPSTGHQVVRFSVLSTNSSGDAGTLAMVLVRGGEVIAYESAVVTPSAVRRTAAANGAGKYLATVAFVQSGTDKADLLGHSSFDGRKTWSAQLPVGENKNDVWYFGMSGLGGLGACDVFYEVSVQI